MTIVEGAGCWPGRAEGAVVWVGALEVAPAAAADGAGEGDAPGAAAPDRAAEVLRFRGALEQALEDLQRWSDQQPTMGGRVLLQTCREALTEAAWSRRASALIDGEGATAAVAVLDAAATISAVMGREPELEARSEALRMSARWLAGRLANRWADLPPDAVVASDDLSPLELLDLGRPALIAGGEPPVVGAGPLVWGVPVLTERWDGRRVSLEGARVSLDPPAATCWWRLDGERLNGSPVCTLNGDPEALQRMSRKLKEAPVAMVHRLDDLAAVPLFMPGLAAVALDFDRLGPAPRLKHPGVQLLLRAAVAGAREARVPLLAGGEAVHKNPDYWLAQGFTALFTRSPARAGRQRGAS